MIKFRHRGLKALYEGQRHAKITPDHKEKLMRILTMLDNSHSYNQMAIPGFHLHPLKGELRGYYSVSVSGNWRVIFRFENGHAVEVDYLDYH